MAQQLPVELEDEAADLRGSWPRSQEGALEQYHCLLRAAREHKLSAFVELALATTPICESSGAEPGGTAFGEWCERCPLHHQYGGCRPIVGQMVRAAEQGNWEAAQLMVLALTAEVAGMRPPTPPAAR